MIGLVWQAMCMTLLPLGVAMAWRWGGRDERLAAGMLVAAAAGTSMANLHDYAATETGIMLVDGALAMGLGGIALRSDRFWPMWMAAFQLVAVMVHAVTLARAPGDAWAYAIGANFWSLPVMLAFGWGVWREAMPVMRGR